MERGKHARLQGYLGYCQEMSQTDLFCKKWPRTHGEWPSAEDTLDHKSASSKPQR